MIVESFFSKLDTCTRATDPPEMDAVRTARLRSSEWRDITVCTPSPAQICEAGTQVQDGARKLKSRLYAARPLARHHRKKTLSKEAREQLLANMTGEGRRRQHEVLINKATSDEVQESDQVD